MFIDYAELSRWFAASPWMQRSASAVAFKQPALIWC